MIVDDAQQTTEQQQAPHRSPRKVAVAPETFDVVDHLDRWKQRVDYTRFSNHRDLNTRGVAVSETCLADLRRVLTTHSNALRLLQPEYLRSFAFEMDALIRIGVIEGTAPESRVVHDENGVTSMQVEVSPSNPAGGTFDIVTMQGGKVYGAMVDQLPETHRIHSITRAVTARTALDVIHVFIEHGYATPVSVQRHVESAMAFAR